jgi:DNA-directed RNA polymerase subunit M/transcription elongation factor TFIIS
MEQFSNNNDELRNKIVIKIDNIIDNINISRTIEKGIYNYIIKLSYEKNIIRKWENIIFRKLYISKVISICCNLDKSSYIKNPSLIKRLNDKSIVAEMIGNLSIYDIYPDNWKELFNKKTERDKIKYELKPEAMTNLYKCRKCGSHETSYYELQTRSADEPMTQFITCIKCNNRWKN